MRRATRGRGSAIRDTLLATRPDLVFVALGFPKQEHLIRQLRESLPHATFIGVGISLSFIANTIRRAPRSLQRLGLQWLHRLAQEPRRLAKRYLLHDLPFALFILLPHALASRFRRPPPTDNEPRTTNHEPPTTRKVLA